MAIWIPGYAKHVFPGRTGYAFEYYDKPKLCWHTTEGGSVGGALGAYAPYPPHAIVNPNTGEKLQHISLDLAAYSAMDNNDNDHIIQFEIVGFAGSSHTWPEWVLKWLGENVVKPVRDLVGVPDNFLRFYGSGEGIVLASPNSPIRLSASSLRNFSGHLGHQHLPAPDEHWDPGRLPIQKIISYSGGTAGTGDDLDNMDEATFRSFVRKGNADWLKQDLAPGTDQRTLLQALLAETEIEVVPDDGTKPWKDRIGSVVAAIDRRLVRVEQKAVADVDEEALAAALAARNVGGTDVAAVKAALADVLKSTTARFS